MPQQENTTTTTQRKKRVQLKHLLIDVDFFDKPKVRALIYKHTQLAALLYIRWLMLMSRADNASVTRDALFSVGREVLHNVGAAIATPESVLAYCIKTGMIGQISDDEYTNSRVVEDQESCAIKRDQAIERQQKFREKKKPNGNALSTRLPVTDTVTDTEDLDLNNNGAPFAQPELPPIDESNEYAIKAREILETPENQPWTRSNAFICEGRRPMKKFPKILLKEPDLARILKEIEEAGVPRGKVGKVFQAANDRIVAGERNGKRPEGLAIEAWLTGFCLTETIEVLKKGMQLKQTQDRTHV